MEYGVSRLHRSVTGIAAVFGGAKGDGKVKRGDE